MSVSRTMDRENFAGDDERLRALISDISSNETGSVLDHSDISYKRTASRMHSRTQVLTVEGKVNSSLYIV